MRCVRCVDSNRDIANQRLDWQWKLATHLCREYDVLVFENLNIDGMKRLWGRKVSDLSFAQFLLIMEQKCAKHGKAFKQVGKWTATTKPCSNCGYTNDTLTLIDRYWICPQCEDISRQRHKRCYQYQTGWLSSLKWR